MDILSFVLGYNKGKARGGGGSSTETDIFPLQTVSGFVEDTADFVGCSLKTLSESFVIKEGETYGVEWDGTTYTCKGISAALNDLNYVYLGNGSGLGYEGNNEPFAIIYIVEYDMVQIIALNDLNETHEIRVYQNTVSSDLEIKPLTVTANGTYTAPDGEAYSPITVSVQASAGTSDDERVKYVTFMYGETELIKYPVIVGDTCKCPVTAGLIEAPTKEPTVDTVYSFGGWSLTDGGEVNSSALENVTEDRTVYFVFAESVRTYTVNFYDGETLVNSEQVAYGGSSDYTYEKDGYTFVGWSPTPTNITADVNCYVQCVENVGFATASWANIAKVSEAGIAEEEFNIGDTKTVTLTWEDGTTEDVEFQIAALGIDTDFDSQKPVITLITKNLITKTSAWATFANRNRYNFHQTDTFKTFLTETVFAALPNDLKAVAKRCVTTYLSGLGDSYNSASYAYYIMPPHGRNMGYSNSSGFSIVEGVTYPIFTEDHSSRVKTLDGVAHKYAVYDNSSYQAGNYVKCVITAQGTMSNATNSPTTTAELGVCFLLFI